MQARADLELRHAVVLKADDVKKIWKILDEAVGQVSATAACTDHITRPFANINDLAEYENPRARQIASLEFSARSSDWQQEVYLRLRELPNTITLRVYGPEPFVSHLKDALADVLDGLRPWYSPIARIIPTYLVSYVLLSVGVISYSMPMPSWKIHFERPADFIYLAIILLFIAGVFLAVFVKGLDKLDKLWKRLFPLATFAIGQGQERHRVDEWIRTGVLIGPVLIGLVIRNILSMLWSLITHGSLIVRAVYENQHSASCRWLRASLGAPGCTGALGRGA